MVRALLEGRKTQTRRIVKGPQLGPRAEWQKWEGESWRAQGLTGDIPVEWRGQILFCPYGVPGDKLWVRETWKATERESNGVDGILFRADDHFQPIANTKAAADLWCEAYHGNHGDNWRPSIFMPRWASRITLELVEVRVERLHDIQPGDCMAEGIELPQSVKDACASNQGGEFDTIDWDPTPHFAKLWDSINLERGCWHSNPCVWVLVFKRV